MNKLSIFFGSVHELAIEIAEYKKRKLSVVLNLGDYELLTALSGFTLIMTFLTLVSLLVFDLLNRLVISLFKLNAGAVDIYFQKALMAEIPLAAYLIFILIFQTPSLRIFFRSPFLKAFWQNNLKDLIVLIGNRDVNSIKVHGQNLLAVALKYGSTSAVRYLLEKGARLSKTADDLLALKFAWAVRLHHEERLDLYLEDLVKMLSVLEESPEEYASFLADIEQEGVSIEGFLHELRKTRNSEALENHLKRLRIEKALEKGHLEEARSLGFED